MTQLTKNFKLDEFRSKCGRPTPDKVATNLKKLAEALQVVRDTLGRSITITSGYRSPEHNAKVKGAKASKHIEGIAADFKVSGMTPSKVVAEVEKLIAEGKIPQGGLKAYSTWVHYDIRGERARW
jgi:uncharacterized protein YcbK (DUF882 family)